MNDDPLTGQRLRLLVAIGCFGTKNLGFLNKLVATYRAMALEVHVVVISEAPKDLGPGVEVVYESPEKDPWFVPFGHRPVLAERADQYDLFIYSEDDTLATERNIRAFLEVSPHLAPDEIAGFLRYELDSAGNYSFPEVHKSFHWKPGTVHRRGPHLVAEFSCEHAAFYLLTQAQLKHCLASGTFLQKPQLDRYDFLCTAATDPYRKFGCRKVICVSAIEDFIIHHLPNRYVGQLGVSLETLKQNVGTMQAIAAGTHPSSRLCETETKIPNLGWSKSYYEPVDPALMQLIPEGTATVLSVGCGWGALEGALIKKGMTITAFPLDSIIGAEAARRGIKVVYGSLDDALRSVGTQKFDCVLVPNLIHLQAKPERLLQTLAQLVGDRGTLVASGPNFDRLPWRFSHLFGIGAYKKLRDYASGGINTIGAAQIAKTLRRAGLRPTALSWRNHTIESKRLRGHKIQFGRLTARDWVLQAQR